MMMNFASWLLLLSISLGAFWVGAYNHVMRDIAIENERIVNYLLTLDMRQLSMIQVSSVKTTYGAAL